MSPAIGQFSIRRQVAAPLTAQLRAFFDVLNEPVLMFDRRGTLSFVNQVGLSVFRCEVGASLDELENLLPPLTLQWLRNAVSKPLQGSNEALPGGNFPDGRAFTATAQRFDAHVLAIRFNVEAQAPAIATLSADVAALLRTLWATPLALCLHDAAGRIVDVNKAYLELTGYRREQLVASDAAATPTAASTMPLGSAEVEHQVVDAKGRRRTFRSTQIALNDAATGSLLLTMLHDTTDRHLEEERDLAQLQMGAMMNTAGAGVATFDTDTGGGAQRSTATSGQESAALQSISRDLVLPESLPDYERLQHAVRHAQRAEIRYAIRHPKLGDRWLVTRVDPVRLASGKRTTSVVTLDITEQHQTQQRSEQLLRDRELMFSLSDVGIAFLREGKLQRANDALAQLSGYSVQDLNGLPLDALFEAAALPEGHDQALRDTGRWTGEAQMKSRDGRAIWVQISHRLVTEGQPDAGVIASYVNVDDRHRAQHNVTLQAKRTRAILDSMLVGIVTVGANGIEWMNRAARRMFGGELSDFLHQPIASVATGDPAHPLRTVCLDDEGSHSEAESFECQVQARDGRAFWVVGNVVATEGEGGKQLTFALLDIERRRQAEARTEHAQASLQRIIEAAPMAITLFDAATLKVVQCNEVAAHGANQLPAQMIGRTPEELIEDGADAARWRADIVNALASSEVTQAEYRSNASGDLIIWDARYMPLAPQNGAPEQVLMVATDVTEQRAAQEARLQAAVAQREMLVKEVHHRIKNNLQGVAGLLQQIAQRKPEVASAISEVVGQVQAIAHVYGLQVGITGPLRLKSVVEAITGSVQRTFGCPIELSIAGTAPHQWALPEAESIPIALAMNELLTNAAKHRASKAEGIECELRFSDQGAQTIINNVGQLSPEFNLTKFPSGVSGLGLVRSLLPRRSATLTIEQDGATVTTTVALSPPGITRLEPA